MAILNQVRYVCTGKLAGGETWSTGAWVGVGTNYTSQGDLQTSVDNVATDDNWDDWQSWLQTHNSPNWTLDKLTAYYYTTVPGPAVYAAEHNFTGIAGSGNSAYMPDQVALVATTLTGAPGRRNRGRLYLPMTSETLGTTGQIGTAEALAAANAVKAFLLACVAGGHNATPNVVSVAGSQANDIIQIRVDTRPDIQRRRANRQAIAGSSTVDLSA